MQRHWLQQVGPLPTQPNGVPSNLQQKLPYQPKHSPRRLTWQPSRRASCTAQDGCTPAWPLYGPSGLSAKHKREGEHGPLLPHHWKKNKGWKKWEDILYSTMHGLAGTRHNTARAVNRRSFVTSHHGHLLLLQSSNKHVMSTVMLCGLQSAQRECHHIPGIPHASFPGTKFGCLQQGSISLCACHVELTHSRTKAPHWPKCV